MEYNFGKIKPILETPNLTEIQRNSYDELLNVRIREILQEVSPVKDYNGDLFLYFNDCYLVMPTESPKGCIEKGSSYSARLMVKCSLENRNTGEIIEQTVCFGEIPVMTPDNVFILSGITRVIVSQIVRSPGIYYTLNKKASSNKLVEGLLMPNTGAWFEILNDGTDAVFVKINRGKKILVTQFLRVLGLDEESIKELLTEHFYEKTLAKDKAREYTESLREVFKKSRPGDLYSEENAKNVINYFFCSPERYMLKEVGRYKLNEKTGLDIPLDKMVLTHEDIIAYIKGYIEVLDGQAPYDDIDHLGNRRVKTIGENVEEKFRQGLSKIIKLVKENISVKGVDKITPTSIINARQLQNSIREFFVGDQLSQMLEETNPLSAITNIRRVSAIGKGGVNKDRAGMEVRDIHYSQFGRLCPIETPDGANIGLIVSLATYASIDKYGFLTTPYLVVNKETGKVDGTIKYINATEEEGKYVAQVGTELTDDGFIKNSIVRARYKGETVEVSKDLIDFIDISTVQSLSIAASMVPFIQNDDATRAGMGANMQRQAVPLMTAESPLVGTGTEKIMGKEYSGKSDVDGVVTYVDCDRIDILTDIDEVNEKTGKPTGNKVVKTYNLVNFFGTKKSTCIRETPMVKVGDKVKKGDSIYDKFSIDRNTHELALGRNVLVAYMPWEGYNYEDAILISERLQKEDVFTSIHIEKHEAEARSTRLGDEKFTKDLQGVSNERKLRLTDEGFAKPGSRVKGGDILVGRITPKGEKDLTPEERLAKAIFGNKTGSVKDTSVKLANGDWGTVMHIKQFTRGDEVELGSEVLEKAQVYIAKKRKIRKGDKMAGRHGNKGVVSKVLPVWEMPYLEDGTPIDIVLNPMGVPSRMNTGQLKETTLGLAAKHLGMRFTVPAFDGPSTEEIKEKLIEAGLPEDGKVVLYDGRTGEPFKEKVTVGVSYMLRLSHIVDEKIHARSTGGYSLINQQPHGGKAQFGGQRFGEMEVWALEAYGAAHTLQEVLTIKSDDVSGRKKTTEAILEGKPLPEPSLPESFKVLDRQLSGLCLKLTINGEDNISQSKIEDLVEDKYILKESISKIVTPLKPERVGDDDDDDYEDDELETLDLDSKEDIFAGSEIDVDADVKMSDFDNMEFNKEEDEYLDDISFSDIPEN